MPTIKCLRCVQLPLCNNLLCILRPYRGAQKHLFVMLVAIYKGMLTAEVCCVICNVLQECCVMHLIPASAIRTDDTPTAHEGDNHSKRCEGAAGGTHLPARSTRLREPCRVWHAPSWQPLMYIMKMEWLREDSAFMAVLSTALALAALFMMTVTSSELVTGTRVAPTMLVWPPAAY